MVDHRGIEPRDADLARISRYPIDVAQNYNKRIHSSLDYMAYAKVVKPSQHLRVMSSASYLRLQAAVFKRFK
jgi:hypothetical protein